MSSPTDYLSLRDFHLARQRISPFIRRTPLILSEMLSDQAGFEIWLKLENLQTTGSFKLRGAANRMLQLSDEERANGIIAVSSGNHGRAVAFMARRLGIRAIVVVCALCPENKRAAMRSYGAELIVHGDTQDEAQAHADVLVDKHGYSWVDPFDDMQVIAGQGTLALEALQEVPDADLLVAPLSGGGLLSGAAIVAKSMSPTISVVGASMATEPGMVRSLEAGRPVRVDEFPSLAGSITGSIGLKNRHTFPIIRDLMDRAVLIPEDSLAPALRDFAKAEGMIVEGGAITAVLAALSPEVRELAPKKSVVVVSGRNIGFDTFQQVTANGMAEQLVAKSG